MEFTTRYFPKNQQGIKVAPTTLLPPCMIPIERSVFQKMDGEKDQIKDMKKQFELNMLNKHGVNWKQVLRKEPSTRITF